jgi:hypothetical protein
MRQITSSGSTVKDILVSTDLDSDDDDSDDEDCILLSFFFFLQCLSSSSSKVEEADEDCLDFRKSLFSGSRIFPRFKGGCCPSSFVDIFFVERGKTHYPFIVVSLRNLGKKKTGTDEKIARG